MCAMFDIQLEGIYSILDNQLVYLKSKKPNKEVVSNKESEPQPMLLILNVLAISGPLWWAWQLGVC